MHDLIQKDTAYLMRPEKGTYRIMTRNFAVVVLVWLLLVASTIVIPQGNLYNALLPSAYGQQAQEAENEVEEQDQREALVNLRALSDIAPGTDLEELLGDLVDVTDLDGLADVVGASDSSELTQTPGVTNSEGLEDLVDVTDLDGLLELVGLSDLQELLDLLIPRPSPTDPPAPEEPPGEEPNPPSQDGGEDRFGIEQEQDQEQDQE